MVALAATVARRNQSLRTKTMPGTDAHVLNVEQPETWGIGLAAFAVDAARRNQTLRTKTMGGTDALIIDVEIPEMFITSSARTVPALVRYSYLVYVQVAGELVLERVTQP